jgi:hypothetical protein
MADNLVLGAHELVAVGAGGVLSFVAGAACSAILVNHARLRHLHSEYALPLLLEALLLHAGTQIALHRASRTGAPPAADPWC